MSLKSDDDCMNGHIRNFWLKAQFIVIVMHIFFYITAQNINFKMKDVEQKTESCFDRRVNAHEGQSTPVDMTTIPI